MTQTASGMSFRAARVWVSPDATMWTDISGFGASIAQSAGDRNTGEVNTFDGLDPIVKGGKKTSLDLTVRFVYTETADEAFDVVRTAHESESGMLMVQYRVKDAGNWFSGGSSIITSLEYPQGEAGDGAVVMSQFAVKCTAVGETSGSIASV